MARTSVSWEALRELAAFRARTGCAVSFYLDLDPHATPTAAAAQTRTRALIDEAHKRAESTRSRRSHQQQASIRAGLERIQRYFDGEFEREGVRGVAVFAAAKDDLWRPLPLPAPVGDAVKFGSELYVTPLVPVAADGNAALVAVVGRERGDLYELRDGRLGPISSRFEEQPRRHDQGGWSQANYQRHVDDLAGKHLRGVAEELERALRRRRNAPLVLACSEEARTEFLGLLPAEARAAVAGWTAVEAHAHGAELLAGVTPVLERRRAEQEEKLVARWHDAMGQSGRATAGWAPTLEAASDGRVDTLLYAANANQAVHRCPACGRLQLDGGSCPLDGAELEQSDEGLDLVLHQTLQRGGSACPIATRPDLDPVGGVGALLRF